MGLQCACNVNIQLHTVYVKKVVLEFLLERKKYPKGSLELNEWSHYTEEFVIIYNADMSQCITSFL